MLYLIATPIGNLGDITYRAIETLQTCDYLLCEDTRHSQILLQRYTIKKPLKSYHKFNEAKREEEVLRDLLQGKNIALLSDAGTPGICDPGQKLVQRCREEKIPYTALPGPCALIVALSLSGLDTQTFQFLGYLPKKAKLIHASLQQMLEYPGVSLCYETPHRLLKTLELLEKTAPNRKLLVARELTKTFEECLEGTPKELQEHFKKSPPRGEIVLLIRGEIKEIDYNLLSPEEHVKELEETLGLSHKEAIKKAAQLRKVPKRILYNSLIK